MFTSPLPPKTQFNPSADFTRQYNSPQMNREARANNQQIKESASGTSIHSRNLNKAKNQDQFQNS